MDSSEKLKKVMKSVKRDDLAKPKREARIDLRLFPDEKIRLEKVARSCDLSLSEFLIQAALFAADKLEKGKGK
ncbi:MAG: hypothetical protein ABIK28_24240 [Planctomycetota bacterium]